MNKKSIISKGLIASGMLYASVNASNLNREEALENENKVETNNNVTKLYQWRVETESKIFKGSSKTMDELNKDINALTKGAKIITKSITPITTAEIKPKEKVYSWSVVTKKGQAYGQSSSLKKAKSMMESFDDRDVLKSNIVESKITAK